MSAILSADDLNDFISPGVACIKPVETLPKQQPTSDNVYEVVKEGTYPEENKAAQITLTDCLACSGCVTSAEAVLISLQSHAEVLSSLDHEGRVFVASISPQVRASIAATYHVTEKNAGFMIEQLLRGPQGLGSGGKYGNDFSWVIDTNRLREIALVLSADEVKESSAQSDNHDRFPKTPILSSACPGWICYAEKTHPHILPHLSNLKSPQALAGTLLKSVLSKTLTIPVQQIWHLAIMPCFDKKLEASRGELTNQSWSADHEAKEGNEVSRDVDCVITTRELLMLAESRGISFPKLPQTRMPTHPFPDPFIHNFLVPSKSRTSSPSKQNGRDAGTSGGYLQHILQTQLAEHPASTLIKSRGRNADVVEYSILSPPCEFGSPTFTAARYYGFRNIQNLVRKLKPVKKSRMIGAKPRSTTSGQSGSSSTDYAYVEVMACPGGCTNGGGQIKIDDLPTQAVDFSGGQKEWLSRVDEAYFSMSSEDENQEPENGDTADRHVDTSESDAINGVSITLIHRFLAHWENLTGVPIDKLVKTTYRQVESDVGKSRGGENDRVVQIASQIGGGW